MTYEQFCEIWDGLQNSLYDPPIDSSYAARSAVCCGNYADELTKEHIEALEEFADAKYGYGAHIEYKYCNDCDKIINNYSGHEHCSECSDIFESLEDCEICADCCNDNHIHCPHCNRNVDSICEHCDNCSDKCCECTICNECSRLVECTDCDLCNRHCNCSEEEIINYGEAWLANSPKSRQEFNNKRLVGVEWEFNSNPTNGESSIIEWTKKWRAGLQEDGSCGREAITAPIAGDYIKKCLTDLSMAFDKSGASIDHTCGIHVHVDVSDFTWNEMLNLIKIYAKFEPLLYLLGGQHRMNGEFCEPTGEAFLHALDNKVQSTRNSHSLKRIKAKVFETAYGLATTEWTAQPYHKHCKTYKESVIHERYISKQKKSSGRYRGLNIIPWIVGRSNKAKDTTVEFRIHRNSNDLDRVLGWTQLLANIVEWTSKATQQDFSNLPNSDLSALVKISPGSKKYIMERIKDWRESTNYKTKKYPRRISFKNGKTTIFKDGVQ